MPNLSWANNLVGGTPDATKAQDAVGARFGVASLMCSDNKNQFKEDC